MTKAITKELIYEEWNDRWITDAQYTHTKFFYPEASHYKAKLIMKLSWAYLQLIIRAITGHNFLLKHQNRIGPPIAPECQTM